MVDWRWTGYNALIFLAAMQAIPRDLYEAAAIDGAGAWQQFWRITVPLLRPTIVFTVIISTIGGLPAVHRAAAVQLRLVQLTRAARCASPRR